MKVKSALLFKPGSIGDSLMGKYFLDNILAQNPTARCTLAVPTRKAMIQDLFAAYPALEVVDTRALRLPRRDVVVTPYTGGIFPLRTKLFARLLAKKLIGFSDHSVFNFLYDKLIPLVGRERAPRLLECDAIQAAGLAVSIERPTFSYIPQPHLLPRLGLEPNQYIVVHLFSGSNTRGLSPERKAALIKALAHTLSLPLVFTGTPQETASLGILPHGACAADTTIQELAHLIDHSRLMVSLDTGAAHLAAHLRKPLVVLASCVGVQWWGKDMYGEDVPSALLTRLNVCAHGHDYSGYAKCLDAIDLAEVAAAAQALL